MIARDFIKKYCCLLLFSLFILGSCSSNHVPLELTSTNDPNKQATQEQIFPSPSPENEVESLIIAANDGIYITNPEMTLSIRITTSMIREDSAPSFSSGGSEIVYGGSDGDIYLIDRAQTWIVNLTNSSSIDRNPKFSPDGKTIAFESDQKGAFSLFVMNKDGSQMKAILNSTNDISIGGWSPDSEKIVYTELSLPANMAEGVPVSPIYTIKMIDLNSGEIVQLVQDGQDEISKPTAPSYSSDGSMIAFQGIFQGKLNIFTISSHGNDLKRITQNDLWQLSGLFWSPEGTNFMVSISPLDKNMGDSFLGLMDLNGNMIQSFDEWNGYVTSWIKLK